MGAGTLGLPLMIAVIGGETARFRPLVDLYRKAGLEAGFTPDQLKVGLHSPGYVGENNLEAIESYYPGYAKLWTEAGKQRGWPPVTRASFDHAISPEGALVVGGPAEVSEKLKTHSEALGGIDRFTFQMDNAGLSHQQLISAIKILGLGVIPLVNVE